MHILVKIYIIKIHICTIYNIHVHTHSHIYQDEVHTCMNVNAVDYKCNIF